MVTTGSDRWSDEAQPSPQQRRRGRRTAWLLFAVGFGPMLLATVMFYTGWLNPAGRSNHGVLLQPVVPVSQLQLLDAGGQPLSERFGPLQENADWLLLVAAGTCDQACEDLLYRARQVNIALGKNANRVDRGAYLKTIPAPLAERWPQQYPAMEQFHKAAGDRPQWPDGVNPDLEPRILLVDPFGNLVMHYGAGHTGKEILEDLKHLLKLSRIG